MIHVSLDDTICALSTPGGIGALGIIRLTGNQAIEILDGCFSKDLSTSKGYTTHFGSISREGQVLDEVIVNIFRGPRSFTGEDTAEISCHGSPFILQETLQLLIGSGARLARPGEFSQRAFLNGKMDLTQTEAVADLIASESETAHRMAIDQMKGGFSAEISVLKEKLIHFASLIELELDFSEEDVEFADRKDLKALVNALTIAIEKLVNSFSTGNAIKNGVPVAIVGAPNSGKSTLLNALLNDNKAIVSDIAGTTRDAIEDRLVIKGVMYRIIDTAGIRQTEDQIETIGIERTFEKANEAMLILHVVDARIMSEELERHQSDLLNQLSDSAKPTLLVANKVDLVSNDPLGLEGIDAKFSSAGPTRFISALTKQNLESVEAWLVEQSKNNLSHGNQVVVSNVRHHTALKQTLTSLSEVRTGLDGNITGDFLAIDIRKALHHLGEITGEITTDDLLGNIFSKFCIGK